MEAIGSGSAAVVDDHVIVVDVQRLVLSMLSDARVSRRSPGPIAPWSHR